MQKTLARISAESRKAIVALKPDIADVLTVFKKVKEVIFIRTLGMTAEIVGGDLHVYSMRHRYVFEVGLTPFKRNLLTTYLNELFRLNDIIIICGALSISKATDMFYDPMLSKVTIVGCYLRDVCKIYHDSIISAGVETYTDDYFVRYRWDK